MPPSPPVKIISDILDLATSPYHAVSARKDDQKLLRWCCLVSKQLYAIAKPMLWSVFLVKRDNTNISTLSVCPLLASLIRVLTFGPLRGKTISAAVEELPNLNEVRIRGGDKITR